MNRRIIAVVEGQSEQTFIRELFAPYIASQGVYLSPRLVGKPGHKGGVRSWLSVRNDICAVLKTDPACLCTTLFDYYKLATDWPGLARTHAVHTSNVATKIEESMLEDILRTLPNLHPGRFIPYIQMHEFEALLFSNSKALASELPGNPQVDVQRILGKVNNPEEINLGEETHPAMHLEKFLPGYMKSKTLESMRLARAVGIIEMINACPHFAEWTKRLSDSMVKP